MRVRQQSTATYHMPIYMVLSSDHLTPATGKTVTVTLSKNGAAFGAASGAVTEVSSGVYKLAGNATDTNTLGSLLVLATATACDPYLVEYTIVAHDPFAAGVTVTTNNDKTGYGLADGAITEAKIATGAIDEDAIADGAINAATLTTSTYDAITANLTASPNIANTAQIADAVADEPRSGHTTAGTIGAGFARVLSGIATGTPTTTTMAASAFVSTHDDQYNNTRSILFTSGVLVGLRTVIRDYVNSTRTFTFDAVHTAPTAGDTFEVY